MRYPDSARCCYPAKLSESELAAASAILSEYRAQYDAAVQSYNDAAQSARSPQQLPDGANLLAQINALTTTTHMKLESSISANSARALYEHVQREKAGMRVAAE
jgi:hypothetical protein